jgi:hypothetical protein
MVRRLVPSRRGDRHANSGLNDPHANRCTPTGESLPTRNVGNGLDCLPLHRTGRASRRPPSSSAQGPRGKVIDFRRPVACSRLRIGGLTTRTSGGPAFEIQICRKAPHSAWEQMIAALNGVNRIYISGRHSLPAAMTACQKSIPRNAITIIRRIRLRVSRPRALSSREVGQSGSLMRYSSDAHQRANLTRH